MPHTTATDPESAAAGIDETIIRMKIFQAAVGSALLAASMSCPAGVLTNAANETRADVAKEQVIKAIVSLSAMAK